MNYFEFRKSWGSNTYQKKMREIKKPAFIKTMSVFSILLFSFICVSYLIYSFFSDFSFYFGLVVGAIIFLFLSFKIGMNYVRMVLSEGQKQIMNEKETEEMIDYYGIDFINYLRENNYIFNYNLILISSKIFEQFKTLQENNV